jgi:glycerate kinase
MAMEHFADRVVAATGVDHRQAPGSGAAGGIAFLLRSALAAEVRDGFSLVAELAGLPEAVRGADLVLTGEGRLDSQSLYGKVPVGVTRMARDAGVPAAAIAGLVDGAAGAFRAEGLLALMPIVDRPMTLDQAMASGADLIARAAGRLAAAIDLGQTMRGQPLRDRAAQPGGETA